MKKNKHYVMGILVRIFLPLFTATCTIQTLALSLSGAGNAENIRYSSILQKKVIIKLQQLSTVHNLRS